MDDKKDRAIAPPPKDGELPYPEHFGNIRITGDLLVEDAARGWLSTLPGTVPHSRHVVWLGCQVLKTAHLPVTLNDILDHLAVEHVTLGGPTNCCGIIHDGRGHVAIGEQLLRQTLGKIDAFTPDRVLYLCPSCDNHLRSKSGVPVSAAAQSRQSVMEFLDGALPNEAFVAGVPLTVAVHAHHGFAEQDAQAAAVRRLLSRIPALRVVDVAPVETGGRHCSDATLRKMGRDAYLAGMRAWIDEARRGGAERVVSIYHSCHRQLIGAQLDQPEQERIGVENYMTVVARALALPAREDKFAYFSAVGDVDRIMGELSDRIDATGIDRERARRAITASFGRRERS